MWRALRTIPYKCLSLCETGLLELIVVFVLVVTISVVIPCFQFGVVYRIWDSGKPTINISTCSCECFDTISKGDNEEPPSAYKHFYLNATKNSGRIWFLVVLGVLLLYETTKYLVPVIRQNKLRHPMFALLLSSLYPHYYGWWVFFNYINEDFYSQWYHQLFFSVTEIISTAMVLHLCNVYNKTQSWKLLLVMNINIMHLIVGGLDLFLMQLIYRGSFMFENVRNLALLLPDMLHVLVCYFEIGDMARRKRLPIPALFYKEEIMLFVLVLVLFSILGKSL